MFGILSKAKIYNTDALGPFNYVSVMFNPESYNVHRGATWISHEVRGQDVPERQFQSGGGGTLNMDLLFDTTESESDVYDTQIADIEDLTLIIASEHRPPIVEIVWGSLAFRGVITELDVTYERFLPDGTPVRARVAITVEETERVRKTEKESPDHTKLHTVKLGETLDQIAFLEYEDPAHWRTIAEANDLENPTHLTPGQRLVLPRLF